MVVTFDKSHPKVGVRFDKPVPMGTTLGGACENNHGLICSVAHLEPHAVSGAATVAAVDALEAAIRTLQRRRSTDTDNETDGNAHTHTHTHTHKSFHTRVADVLGNVVSPRGSIALLRFAAFVQHLVQMAELLFGPL